MKQGPKPIDWSLYEKRKHVDRDTQGECYVTTEAEIGMMQLQAKECQEVTTATKKKKKEARKKSSLRVSKRA